MHFISDKTIKWIIRLVLTTGILLLANACYIPSKAKLAQVLLDSAWQETLKSERPTKPWPWADTLPVARLRVREHGIDQIVLHGDKGNSLAFGPGLHPDSDIGGIPGTPGMTVISAHRDTHFNFLKDIKLGEIVELQTKDGNITRYYVEEIRIVESANTRIQSPEYSRWLTLVTCYPFDTIQSDPSRRYIVLARAVV